MSVNYFNNELSILSVEDNFITGMVYLYVFILHQLISSQATDFLFIYDMFQKFQMFLISKAWLCMIFFITAMHPILAQVWIYYCITIDQKSH